MSRYTAIRDSGPIADQKLTVLKEVIQARKAAQETPRQQPPKEPRTTDAKKR